MGSVAARHEQQVVAAGDRPRATVVVHCRQRAWHSRFAVDKSQFF